MDRRLDQVKLLFFATVVDSRTQDSLFADAICAFM
jgi:hypothetical protein